MLDTVIAQSIVDRTMSVLNVNVNIMDVEGKVIAAGNKARIGTFHCAAAEVIATGRKKSVTAAEAAAMESVEQGVTQPIVYKQKIIGALGMTGAPETVGKYVELAVLSAQLIIEQEEMKKRVYQEQRARESILVDLFTGRCLEDEQLFRQRLPLLGYRLDAPQLLVAAHLSALEEQADPLRCQQLKDRLIEHISDHRIKGRALAACFMNQHMAILCPLREGEGSRASRAEIARGLGALLRTESRGGVLLAPGDLCPDWRRIPGAFSRAEGVLDLAKRNPGCGGIAFFEDYMTEYTLLRIPPEARQAFYRTVLGSLLGARDEQRALSLQTLKTYYQNDMNAQKTAQELFIHRNTLNIRLNRIRELTGYAPQTFQDAFVLRMAILLGDL